MLFSILFINFAVFKSDEQNKFIEQTMNNLEIINRAVVALNERIPTGKAEVQVAENAVFLILMGKKFWCVVEPNLTVGRMLEHTQERPANVPKDAKIIYITIYATPKTMDYAKATDINILDCAGNFKLQYPRKDGRMFFMVANRGENPVADIERPNTYPIFKETGLKVIFYFLMDKVNIGKPFREIQEATGVAIGTVKNVVDGMAYYQFARIEGRKRFLTNIDRLLMLWAANYGMTLKPKLLLARMAFRNIEIMKRFKELELPTGMLWGGEPSAALTTGYMNPEEFTIYTEVPATLLIKTGTVKPDRDGDILLYKKFWKENDEKRTVPPVLTYADLMETGNGRCIESAQKMKEHELAYLF